MALSWKHGLVYASLSLPAVSFPFALEANQAIGVPSLTPLTDISKARSNCGVIPCVGFNPRDQLVSTTGEHAYAAPGPGDIRGPCPGLNAAANHGYLPRSGVATILESIDGLGESFGMGPLLTSFLSTYAVLMAGDPITLTWSIGGPQRTGSLSHLLLGQPRGISYSHNKYETDRSVARSDAYINNGDAYSLDLARFKQAYEWGVKDGSDRYDLDKFAQDFRNKGRQSVETNPYFFSAPFSGVTVAPAAYLFTINLMSNHSADEPSGYLNGEMFKSFFAVEGDYPNFKWLPGQDRIPDNWYRRPSGQLYDSPNLFADIAVQYTAYPDSLYLGGNVNGINSYVGVDLSDLTGGAMDKGDLFDIANPKLLCLVTQLVQSVIPDATGGLLSLLSPVAKSVLDLVNTNILPLTTGMDCPVAQLDDSLFDQFPGRDYCPEG